MKFKGAGNCGTFKITDGGGCALQADIYRDTPRDDPKNAYHFVFIVSEEDRPASRVVGLTRKQGRDLALAILKELSK